MLGGSGLFGAGFVRAWRLLLLLAASWALFKSFAENLLLSSKHAGVDPADLLLRLFLFLYQAPWAIARSLNLVSGSQGARDGIGSGRIGRGSGSDRLILIG
ncbi:hypothetical protein FIBSPDRAFT_969230 [Athelia psychrophila]|uniref:Uncharacterized protein n=1 Tax=Athelia psychrophila TaxID=1759441 RepID=A0A167TR39_9AGAM|nr:hypothetical protein FIBSPDRAFT_969230 [Fibularhizoctonia sp. CBS 109695]